MVTRDRGSLNCSTLVINRYDGFKRAVSAAFRKIENVTQRVIATTIWVHLIKWRWCAALFFTLAVPTGLAGCEINILSVQSKDFA